MVRRVLLCALMLLMLGCARLEIRKATSSDTEGLRFYRPWPYLWITVNDKGQCIPSITYLPDLNQEYLIVPHPGFGLVTMKPTLQNGWNLTAIDSTVDSKAADVLNGIGGIIGKVAPGGMVRLTKSEKALGPGLYRFVYTNGEITDLTPIFQTAGEDSSPIACPALKGTVEDKPGTPPR
jgi:hypothetical protein